MPPPDRPEASPASSAGRLVQLAALGRELAGVISQDAAVRHTLEVLQAVLAPDHALVVVHLGTRQPRIAYVHGLASPSPDDPLIALAASGGPLLVSHVTPDFLDRLDRGVGYPVRSWMGVPLHTVGDSVGAVSLAADAPGRFDHDDLGFLEAATAQLSVALEQTRLLQLLSRGKQEWEQMVDAIPQAFCVVDEQGTIRRANRAFSVIAHIPVTALAGRPWLSVLPDDWTDAVARAVATVHESLQYEIRAGSAVFTVYALPLREPGGVVLVFDDQTEKRRLQEQLIQSAKLSAIGQLIAGVAHDLNNPLASVVGFADYLVEEAGPPEEIRRPLEAIRDEAERAARIVRQLLDFARKQEAKRQPESIGPILDATLSLLRNQLMASKVDAELEIEPDLPTVTADRHQIQQVFVNLITNAAGAIRTTGREGHILLRAVPWLDGVAVTVEDDGPGVPPEVAGRIFEPFFTTKAEGEGTGLGLSICQGIVKEHGGRIGYEPRAGGGSVFRVELPGGGSAERTSAPVPGLVGTLHVLVVEDEPHIQHYLRATLEAWGHTVVLAGDGSAALEATRAATFDVILTDLRMPSVGGREFYETLQQTDPDAAARVVFATGDTVGDDALRFLETSGRPFLRKPFTLGELRAALVRTPNR